MLRALPAGVRVVADRGFGNGPVIQCVSTEIYRQRCAVMHESLERHFPGAFRRPEYGGGSIWLRLPGEADAGVLRDLVQEQGVFFEPGGFTFSDEKSNRNHIRLGYSLVQKSLIPEGIDIIAKALPDARVS